MKKIIADLLVLCAVAGMSVYSQPQDGPRGGGKRQMEVLTDKQKAVVKDILSSYNPERLTADDAKAIHKAFHDAGLRGGPAIANAIEDAGFDPEKLRELAPPPEREGRRGRGRGRGRGRE